jgi:hypothetical protein
MIAKVLMEEHVSSERTRQLVQKIFCYHRLAQVAFSTAVIAEEK